MEWLLSLLYSHIKKYCNIGSKNLIPTTIYLMTKPQSNALHPGLNPLHYYFINSNDLLILQNYSKHSMLSLSRFHAKTTLSSPTLGRRSGLGAKDLRLRFILFQLLQVVAFLHEKDLVLDYLSPGHIMLDDDMWLTLPVGFSKRSCNSAMINKLKYSTPVGIKAKSGTFVPSFSSIEKPVDYYEPLTVQWVSGKISNFQYLMAINYAAGRSMADPLYHPILPWITDFSVEHSPLGDNNEMRDLTKTKFRLSKGEAQLDTTYRHSDPPHHIPESLSELTYYIYMARRTPLQVLRRVVRDVFVPEHYPHSISRMYDWTPDECIPEFFTDPSVFQSIHSSIGLADLELPYYAPTPHEFIAYHRRVLESDFVSRSLHHWIDLTFGYCLEGDAAIENLNVPLKHTLSVTERLGDSPNLDKHPGFVMLFGEPHPNKLSSALSEDSFDSSRSYSRSTKMSYSQMSSKLLYSSSSTIQGRIIEIDEKQMLDRDLQAFADLDTQTGKGRRRSTPRLDQGVSDTKSSSANGVFHQSNSGKVKFSLHRAQDYLSSWSKLKQADSIDLSFDGCSTKALRLRSDLAYASKFALNFGSFLEPVYRIPENIQIIDDTDICWDLELQQTLNKLKVTNCNQTLESVEMFKKDDMFAIGCIVAEIYLGKPLLAAQDFADGKVDFSYLMRKVYESSEQLPLVIKRLIAVLLYPRTTSLIHAKEILQACSSVDYDILRKRDFAELRSDGACNAFVDFTDLFSCCDESKGRSDSISRSLSIFEWSWSGSKFLEKVISQDQSDRLPPSSTLDVITEFCGSLFPSYFKNVYNLIGRMKLCRNGLDKFRVLVSNLSMLSSLPLEGLGILMPHILQCISDPSCFRTVDIENQSNLGASPVKMCPQSSESPFVIYNTNFSKENVIGLSESSESGLNMISQYPLVIDILGSRLGVDITEKIVVPRVVEFINQLNSPALLQTLLQSHIWHILIIRGGVKSFFRYFLPLLLTYLVSGTLQNISKGISVNDSGISPLWATMGISDKSEWLHLCSERDIQIIQQNAVVAIGSLVDPGGLGPGLSARYLVPALMSLVGIPQLASANYCSGISGQDVDEFDMLVEYLHSRSSIHDFDMRSAEVDENDRPSESTLSSAPSVDAAFPQRPKAKSKDYREIDPEEVENRIMTKLSHANNSMYTVKALVTLCFHLGEVVTSELVLARIFDDFLPELESQLLPIPSAATVSALLELTVLLAGIFPSLSQEVVEKYFLHPHRPRSFSLPKLLTSIPIVPGRSVIDDCNEGCRIGNIDSYIECGRRHMLLLELCRLVVSTSMFVGPASCIEYVLPSVDKFFASFIDAYCLFPVESRTMYRGFELGVELFLPLSQLTNDDFFTCVPSLNPRLEMWLRSVGSGGSRKSPPLPSNILPEAVVDNTQKDIQKKKGLMNWISVKSKKFLSTSSSSSVKECSSSSNVNNLNASNMGYNSTLSSASSSTTLVSGSSASSVASSNRTPFSKSELSLGLPTSEANGDLNVESNNDAIFTENSPELSPVAAMQMHSLRKHSLTHSALRTPFSQHIAAASLGPGTALTNISTEGMELKAIPNDLLSTPYSHINSLVQGSGTPQSPLLPIPSGVSRHNNRDGEDNDDQDIDGGDQDGSEKEERIDLQDNDVHCSNNNESNDSDDDSVSMEETNANDNPLFATMEVDQSQNDEEKSIDNEYVNRFVDGDNNDAISDTVDGSVAVHTTKENVERKNADRKSFVKVQSSTVSHPLFPSLFVRQLLSGHDGKHPSDSFSPSSRSPMPIPLSSQAYSAASSVSNRRSKSILLSSSKTKTDSEEEDEEDARELHYHEQTWLLGGNGKWAIDREKMSSNSSAPNASSSSSSSSKEPSMTGNSTKWKYSTNVGNLAAQISMTSPRISVDVASDMSSLFALNMSTQTQWRIEDVPSSNHNQNAAISCLVTNASESLLLSCSQSGVKLWSLNSHPVKHVLSYRRTDHVPFCASFLRSGTQVATCDGSVNIYDLEQKKTLCYLSGTPNPFRSMSSISPRYGIVPSIGPYGDDELLLCAGDVVSHYDFRSNSSHACKCLSEWHLPTVPLLNVSAFSTSLPEETSLTSVASQERYLVAGSSNGCLFTVDRRMGRVLHSWSAHESPILRVRNFCACVCCFTIIII